MSTLTEALIQAWNDNQPPGSLVVAIADDGTRRSVLTASRAYAEWDTPVVDLRDGTTVPLRRIVVRSYWALHDPVEPEHVDWRFWLPAGGVLGSAVILAIAVGAFVARWIWRRA